MEQEELDLDFNMEVGKPAVQSNITLPSANKENKHDIKDVRETIQTVKKFNQHLESQLLMKPNATIEFKVHCCEAINFMMKGQSEAYNIISDIRQRLIENGVQDVRTLKDKFNQQVVVVRVVSIEESEQEVLIQDQSGMECLVVDAGFMWLGLITAIRVSWEYGKYHLKETIASSPQTAKTTKIPVVTSTTKQTKITIVSGPYSSPTEMDFLGVQMVKAMTAQNRSNILIFMGPFVDYNHPSIRQGKYPKSFNSVLDDIINTVSNGLSNVKIYVVPSIYDVTHGYPLPQPRMVLDNKMVISVGNPSLFTSDELSMQIINQDFVESIRGSSVGIVKSQLVQKIYDKYLMQDLIMSAASGPIAESELGSLYLKGQPHGDLVVYSSRTKQANVIRRGNTLFLNVGSLMGNSARVGNLTNVTYFNIPGSEVCDSVYVEIKKLVY